jgi:hypothetical protein
MRKSILTLALLCAALLAVPAFASASGVNAITVSPGFVDGGASTVGTVRLDALDPQPTTVLLFSSDPSAAQVPANVVVPPNTLSATFPVTSSAAAPPTPVVLTASVDNFPRTTILSVNMSTPAPAGPSLSALSVTPSTIRGGASATGTATFSGALTSGALVNMTSSDPSVVQVPAQPVLRAGTSSVSFIVTTSPVLVPTAVTLTAKWFDQTATTTVTVSPDAPAAVDKVTIKKAENKIGQGQPGVTVEATSTNPKAILGVYRGGFLQFTLTSDGKGKWTGSKQIVDVPPGAQIEVRSNFGGSAFATLK